MADAQERPEIISQSIESAVRRYCEDRGREDTRTRGDGFVIWCLTDLFGFEHADAVDVIVDGPNDRSIDAVANDGNRIVVIQGKYNSHSWAEITKFREDMRAVASGSAVGLPARMREGAAMIRSQQLAGVPPEYFYITNVRFSGADESRIGSLSGEPEIQALDLDAICDILVERETERPPNAPLRPVRLKAAVQPMVFGDSLIFPVNLLEFSRFIQDGEKWLFDSNVRQYLAKSRINQGIRQTVESDSSHFWRYNNGVTMVVDDFEISDGVVTLTKPQIVNGCQTSLSVKRVISGLDPSELEGITGSVLVRVIKERDDAERRNITQFTNKQNAVRGKDFFALKDFQKLLKARIDKLGYFYEIQTGSFDMLKRSERERLQGDQRYAHLGWVRRDYRVPAIEAAKCHAAAFRSRVAVCYANPGDLAPNGELYDTIFPSDLPDAPELFLLPFLLVKHAEKELGYGVAKGSAWRRRGRYMFIFAAFRALSDALHRAGRLSVGESLGPEHSAILRELLSSEAATTALVRATDRVMVGFFSDSATDRLVNNDIFAFLKGPVEKKESTDVLDLKIRHELESGEGEEFVRLLQGVLPAT